MRGRGTRPIDGKLPHVFVFYMTKPTTRGTLKEFKTNSKVFADTLYKMPKSSYDFGLLSILEAGIQTYVID